MDDGERPVEDQGEARALRRQARDVGVRAVVVAVVLTALTLPW